ncbi:serine protease DegP homolog [Oppia nitens]|uniref:serine protease DegP homolog n=1 Tax=Oppia nitens TaxID=1686743 RepID=UPI0023DCCD99|nr:serine protease DegP homolog [Oppia nitens]
MVKIMIPSFADFDKILSNGSGFRMNGNSELSIITNAHVVSGSHLVALLMHFNGQLAVLPATVTYVEQHRDLAMLELLINHIESDHYQALPFSQSTQVNDMLGEPVVCIGHTRTLGEKSCHTGIVQSVGINVGHQYRPYEILLVDAHESCPLVMHSAPILPGYSGGPALTSTAQVFGVQVMVKLEEDFSFAITLTDLLDFIENSKQYAMGLNVRQLIRKQRYTLAPGYKLGLILSNTIDGNNTELTIENIIPQSRNIKYIGQQIANTDIKQLTDNLNTITSKKTTLRVSVRKESNKPLMLTLMTAIDYTEPDLPIIF